MAATKDKGVDVKQLPEKLGNSPYALRKVIRGLDLGVSRGTRYSWPGMAHADVKKITTAWEAAKSKTS